MCPEWGSNHLVIRQYDHGACRETGYHDGGERFHCRDCGDEGDERDSVRRRRLLVSVSERGPKPPQSRGLYVQCFVMPGGIAV